MHLETDKNASITLQASDVKGKTGFIKTGDLNLKDAHKTEQSYDVYEAGPLTFSPAESYTERRSKATSVGSNLEVDRLHLAVEKDVNQVGSTLKTQQLSGIVKVTIKRKRVKMSLILKRKNILHICMVQPMQVEEDVLRVMTTTVKRVAKLLAMYQPLTRVWELS